MQNKDDLISSEHVDSAFELGLELGFQQGAANERKELKKFFENLKKDRENVDDFLDKKAKELVQVKKEASKANKDFLQVAKEIIAGRPKS